KAILVITFLLSKKINIQNNQMILISHIQKLSTVKSCDFDILNSMKEELVPSLKLRNCQMGVNSLSQIK
ncbi:MAG: hypothetical protein RLZZ466_656, partial [Bacteroidota bacterium]